MNPLRKPAQDASAGLAVAGPVDGYHSEADARRMRQLVQALLDSRRPIALTCADPQTLAHYSRLLVRDLRQHPQVQVRPHLPATPEVMLERLNTLLADLPLELGVDRSTPAVRPVQVFVVHDTPRLAAEELALLVRLVNDLPGANLRLVLVQERDLAVTGSLQALGPQVLHWNILPPGVSAAEAASAERAREALRDALQGSIREMDFAPGGTARPASKAPRGTVTGRTNAKSGTKALLALRSKPDSKPGSKSIDSIHATASFKANTHANANARHNWAILTGGLTLSAALAVGLGLWISNHAPAARQLSASVQYPPLPHPAAYPATRPAAFTATQGNGQDR